MTDRQIILAERPISLSAHVVKLWFTGVRFDRTLDQIHSSVGIAYLESKNTQ